MEHFLEAKMNIVDKKIYPGIRLNETTLSMMPASNPPEEVIAVFNAIKNLKGLNHITLHYISSKDAKKYCPGLTFIGEIGEADYNTGTCHVVESDAGIFTTMFVALHELRHFYDGPHPWPEEKIVNRIGESN